MGSEWLYANDLALVDESLTNDLKEILNTWKGALEPKGLRVDVK